MSDPGFPVAPTRYHRGLRNVSAGMDNDRQFQQFYPQSCIDDGRCDAFGQQTGIIGWTPENDSTIREQYFSFHTQQANGTLLSYWATEFVRIGAGPGRHRLSPDN